MKIYTLTLNPAYDVHAYIDEFTPYHENLAHLQSKIAGGKGVNISRALNNAGICHTAMVVVGSQNAADFKKEITDCGIESVFIERPGMIRENLTFHCGNAPETRISFSGFSLDRDILDVLNTQMTIDSDTYVTFTGRLPKGISVQDAIGFLKKLQDQGAKIILDSKSFALEDIFTIRPWLIKPNQEEISELFGCEINTFDDCLQKAKVFCDRGVTNVMVSLGEQGALLLNGGNTYIATPPAVEAVSTIGAGDSTIAGFLTATYQGLTPEQCLAVAVSFGTAACLTEGTQPPVYAQANEILDKITVKTI